MPHYRYTATHDAPWWALVPDASDKRRYDRARRLSQFRKDVARGETVMMSAALIAYRRECLARWQEYLDGWAPPLPARDNGRPPKLRH